MPIGIKMLECSLAQGWAASGLELGAHFLMGERDATTGLPYLQKAAALGHSQSLYILYSAFNDGEYGVGKDPVRAACYKKLEEEADADKTKRFPNIDKICPLPPKPMQQA